MTTDLKRRLEPMPLAAITAAEKNPKKHADEQIGASIGRFGYVEPVVLDERTGRLVAGHGRIQALRRARDKGEPAPEGVEARDGEWLVPVMRGWASKTDAEAQAYLIASNRLTEAGGWEWGDLADMLKELEAQGSLQGVGYSDDELAKFYASIESEALLEPNESGEPNASTDVLKVRFGKWILPITAEVAERFESRLKSWIAKSGTTHGFVADLLGGAR